METKKDKYVVWTSADGKTRVIRRPGLAVESRNGDGTWVDASNGDVMLALADGIDKLIDDSIEFAGRAEMQSRS